jgi:hypothetical protein
LYLPVLCASNSRVIQRPYEICFQVLSFNPSVLTSVYCTDL